MNHTILEHLLASEEPMIRYKAQVHLLDEDPYTPEIRQLQNEIKVCDRVRRLLSERDADGKIPYHPYAKWYGAHWVLVTLADMDYPADDIELILLREQVYALLFSDGRLRSITRHTRDRRTHMCASMEGNAISTTKTTLPAEPSLPAHPVVHDPLSLAHALPRHERKLDKQRTRFC